MSQGLNWSRNAWALLAAIVVSLAFGTTMASAAEPSISKLVLINADSDQPIAAHDPLTDGSTIDLASPTRHLNMAAEPATTPGSIVFDLDGAAHHQVENDAPYSLFNENLGDYQSWTPAVGSHTLTVTAYTGANGTGTAGTPTTINFTVVDSTPSTPSTPYTAPVALPGTIQAEEFDKGGEGVAYHDFDAMNDPAAFRGLEGVDIESTSDATGKFNVGHIRAGEWLAYTIKVATAGVYDVGVRWASGNSGGTGHFEYNGSDISGSIALGSTGDWQTWSTLWTRGVNLPAGTGVLRFVLDSDTGEAEVGNLNFITVKDAAVGTKPRWVPNWQPAASAPEPRFEQAATTLGGKIYAFGGFSSAQFKVNRTYVVYDPAANKWASLGTMPTGMAETHLGIVGDGVRYIYFAGGFGGDLDTTKSPTQWISDKVFRYDTQTKNWSEIAKLPQPRGAGALRLVGRKLHYFGGNLADRVTNTGDHFVYDLDTGVWTTAAPMPDPKDHFSTAVIGTKIYAVGGEHGHDSLHLQRSTVDAYDTVTDTWTRLDSLPVAKSHAEAATFVLDGKVVMAGGQLDNYQPTSQVVSYDPDADVWTTLPALPALRQGAVLQPIGEQLVLTFGAVQTNQPQATTWTGQLPPPPPPTNTAPPSAGTTAMRDVTQNSQAGTWTGATTITEQWQRCTDAAQVSSCVNIGGAVSVDYTPVQADVGQYLRLVETGKNAGGQKTAASAMTAKVTEPPSPPAPSTGSGSGTGTVTGAGNTTPSVADPLVVAPGPGPSITIPSQSKPPAKVCRSTRTVTLRWTAPRGRRLQSIVVSINGKKLATLRGYRQQVSVKLTGLPKRTKVTIKAKDKAGKTLTASRTYGGCGTPATSALRLGAPA